MGFPGDSDSKVLPAAQETQVDPWVGTIPWRREWLLQYPCLENSMDRGAWEATVHRVEKSQTQLK